MYEVVYPLGRKAKNEKKVAPRLKSLDGMTIATLSNHKFNCELTFDLIEKTLTSRYPNIKFIKHTTFGDTYGNAESSVIKSLPDKLRDLQVDAVISGNAG